MRHGHANSIELAPSISREFLLHHGLCPESVDDDGVLVVGAVPRAMGSQSASDLSIAYERDVRLQEVSQQQLEVLIERLASRPSDVGIMADSFHSEPAVSDVRELASQPPVVRYVNLIMREAFDAQASDIHLEATTDGLSARFRIDGVLVPATAVASELQHAVVSRLKLLAELDIAERRRPQDGRIRIRLESRNLDLRVSTVPTLHGESVVLRLLERGGRPVSLDDLGMAPEVRQGVERIASQPHGLFVVTGPTGSGKTTTLYAALGCRHPDQEKILTVEDPVEYQLAGVSQIPVNQHVGVGFASALRSLLRQDPDVIMIGEMRDAETAQIAIQAAMTGHLVFTTLHTNDAMSAVPRLLDLGVADYLIAGTLDGVLAQRLVRKTCEHCRVEYEPSPENLSRVCGRPVGRMVSTRGLGCPRCRGTGYAGRTGIYELIPVSEDLRSCIAKHGSRQELRNTIDELGGASILSDGWRKVESGVTTVEEVLRVLQ